MTTFEEIIKRAEGLGLPIARNQFTATNKKPVPDPPFLVYLSAERQRGDDTKTLHREKSRSGSGKADRRNGFVRR